VTRRSWIVNPNPPYNLIPKEEYVRPTKEVHTIMPDFADFVSPIDGTVIKGRKGYREHCKLHNVTGTGDFKEQWKKPRVDPVKADKPARLEAVIQAYEKHQRKR
jgi:hypothetical protein